MAAGSRLDERQKRGGPILMTSGTHRAVADAFGTTIDFSATTASNLITFSWRGNELRTVWISDLYGIEADVCNGNIVAVGRRRRKTLQCARPQGRLRAMSLMQRRFRRCLGLRLQAAV